MDLYQSEKISGNKVKSRIEHIQNHLENSSQSTLLVFMNPFIHFSWAVTEVMFCLQECLQNSISLTILQ